MRGRLSGKIALITGAASGIGRASALCLAREGAFVVVGDIQEQAGQACIDEIRSNGGAAEFHHLDVADEKAWMSVAAIVRARHQRLDVLVNNAGIGIGGLITDLSLADW